MDNAEGFPATAVEAKILFRFARSFATEIQKDCLKFSDGKFKKIN